MPTGTLDIMKLGGGSPSYQIMFEENAGGTFVARVEPDNLVKFMHEEMRIELPRAVDAAREADRQGRTRMPGVFLEENNLHAIMDYLEEADLGEE
jgi:hypothetical protein